jgi:hypothetical protein
MLTRKGRLITSAWFGPVTVNPITSPFERKRSSSRSTSVFSSTLLSSVAE